MKTYLLNLYYPELKPYVANVNMAKDFVERLVGKSGYRVIRYGGSICSIAFATDTDPKTFGRQLHDLGQDQFQYLILEISAVHAGWTDRSVYQWLEDRLQRG